MIRKIIFVILPVLIVLSCATLSQLFQQPTVKLNKFSISDFSFNDITLNFDLAITNPNPIGVGLAGYDFDFSIEGQNFLSGDQKKDMQVLANQTSIVGIPLTVKFNQLYEMFKALKDKDEANYGLKGHMHVNGPLGLLQIPFSTSGKMPAVKLPKISLAGVKVNTLSLSGVKLNLDVEVDNPNIFGFNLNNFNYNIALAGKNVLSGTKTDATVVNKKGKSTLSFPVDLNFLAMGSMLKSALETGKIDYQLTGGTDVKTEYGSANVPIDMTGVTRMWK